MSIHIKNKYLIAVLALSFFITPVSADYISNTNKLGKAVDLLKVAPGGNYYWLARKPVAEDHTSEWSKLILFFGYADNGKLCYGLISLVEEAVPKPTHKFKCIAANQQHK